MRAKSVSLILAKVCVTPARCLASDPVQPVQQAGYQRPRRRKAVSISSTQVGRPSRRLLRHAGSGIDTGMEIYRQAIRKIDQLFRPDAVVDTPACHRQVFDQPFRIISLPCISGRSKAIAAQYQRPAGHKSRLTGCYMRKICHPFDKFVHFARGYAACRVGRGIDNHRLVLSVILTNIFRIKGKALFLNQPIGDRFCPAIINRRLINRKAGIRG